MLTGFRTTWPWWTVHTFSFILTSVQQLPLHNGNNHLENIPKGPLDKGQFISNWQTVYIKPIILKFDICCVLLVSDSVLFLFYCWLCVWHHHFPMNRSIVLCQEEAIVYWASMLHSGSTAALKFLHEYFYYYSLFRVNLDQKEKWDHRFVSFAFVSSILQSKIIYMYIEARIKLAFVTIK